MKRVLITGKNSYVGNSFADWVKDDSDINVEKISLRNGSWRKKDLSEFDVVLHVAGIAHQKETKENKDLYYQINRDLTIELANKAKAEGVSHFVFLSSMSVYGIDTGVIDENTPLKPNTNYGKSKLEAEKAISTLESSSFNIAILRPPMIYGKGCKGNYIRLSKLARKSFIFPNIPNKRSMIYIDNLSMLIKEILIAEFYGLILLQNKEYVSTSEMVKLIAKEADKKIIMTKVFNPFVNVLISKSKIVKKIFGDLIYTDNLVKQKEFNKIGLIDFKKSIRLTEE
ncbi:NAD-dependent epimerase/dehydratase family protein [Oceanobacillus kimchii]|uniref:NAD-dependent epimerase/dehydratase family protein n=1 Tax=Oceanobacillus kimchii TaxID=746691 RepID=UPI0021A4088C|nr:NAD-dependent epimerase/dehydratase family protein [Oceanobacillus kimchii]MCT2134617.1 NAD-dependent epimerase/dehydratase family protein [Oceanobacillus kimchii]